MVRETEYGFAKFISRDAELTAIVDQHAPADTGGSNRGRWQATFPAVARLRESADWNEFLRIWGARHGSAESRSMQRMLKRAVQRYYYGRLR